MYTLTLPEQSDIRVAESIHHEMETVLASEPECVIDAAQVQKIDTAILQLLLSFQRSARKMGGNVAWGEVSESFRNSAGLMGLAEALVLP